MFSKVIYGSNDIGDVAGEITFREFSLAVAKSGEIKTEYRITFCSKGAADAKSRNGIFGASKAVAENSISLGRVNRHLQPCIQDMAIAACKYDFDSFSFWHQDIAEKVNKAFYLRTCNVQRTMASIL